MNLDDKNVILSTVFGSQIYGTNLPTSDTDYKAIFIPTAQDIVLQKVTNALNTNTKINKTDKNTEKDVDMEFFSYQKYINLLLDGQTVAIDVLFTKPMHHVRPASNAWNLIVENKTKLLSNKINAVMGYAYQQSSKYGQKGGRVATARATMDFFNAQIATHGHLAKVSEIWNDVELFSKTQPANLCSIIYPDTTLEKYDPARMLQVCNRKVQEFVTLKEASAIFTRVFNEYGSRAIMAENNEGVDFKALYHCVRVLEEGKELLLTGQITFPRPEVELLLKIRKGEMQYKDVSILISQSMEELLLAQKNSILPNEPDYKFANELVYQIYLDSINGK